MKYKTTTISLREIVVPVKHGILNIPMSSPSIQIIDDPYLEKEGEIQWKQLVESRKILIFLDDVFSLATIVKELLAHGKHPMTDVSLYGFDEQNQKKIITGALVHIKDLRLENNMMYLETIIVGDLQLFARNGYFKKKPLWGKKIVTTRSKVQSHQMVSSLENLGANVLEFPLMELKASTNYDIMQAVLAQIQTYEWIIFGMNMSVDYFIAYLLGSGYDLSCLKNCKICALSQETVERLTDFGIDLHYLPSSYGLDLDKVIEGLEKSGLHKEKPILVVTEEKKGTALSGALEKLDLSVTFIPILKSVSIEITKKKMQELLDFCPMDIFIFNGPFGIRECRGILQQIDRELKQSLTVAIGPQTRDALEQEGITVDLVSKELTIPSLIETITDYYDIQAINHKEA